MVAFHLPGQLALPLPDAMVAGDRRCGNCVQLNGMDAERGYCTVGGRRRRDQAPCPRWFGLEQLQAAVYGRARS